MPGRPDKSEIPTARLSGFAPAIASLLALGLPAKRLSELFGTNPNHIYVLAHRGRLNRYHRLSASDEAQSEMAINTLTDDSILGAKSAARIRLEEDGVELTNSRAGKLGRLEARIEEIAGGGRKTYRFLQAASALQTLKPYIGYPSESNRLRLAAKVHQHLAWFYSQSGFTSSSIQEATYSIHLYSIVYHNTGYKEALRELGGSCLIGSNSRLLQCNPEAALTTLNLAKQATEAAGIALNSDYYRQMGVAMFQKRQDTKAKVMFERAIETTPDSDVKHGTLTLKMAGHRHLYLITSPFPHVDDELILLDEVKAVFGVDSLEAAMCTHWAAACALCTDSPKAHLLALDLIRQNKKPATRFGHQATIAKLLPMALELPAQKRSLWTRFALYQNAYRSK